MFGLIAADDTEVRERHDNETTKRQVFSAIDAVATFVFFIYGTTDVGFNVNSRPRYLMRVSVFGGDLTWTCGLGYRSFAGE